MPDFMIAGYSPRRVMAMRSQWLKKIQKTPQNLTAQEVHLTRMNISLTSEESVRKFVRGQACHETRGLMRWSAIPAGRWAWLAASVVALLSHSRRTNHGWSYALQPKPVSEERGLGPLRANALNCQAWVPLGSLALPRRGTIPTSVSFEFR
jgi:hypothetical protein